MASSSITVKLVLIGESGAGKTSLRNQYLHNRFNNYYKSTIGADFYSKKIQVGSTQVNLMIWDTAGQERFASLSNAFIRGADACLLVFDATKPPNLETLRHWFETFRSNSPVFDNDLNDFCLTAIGNKIDAIDCNSFPSEDYVDTIKFLHPNSQQFKSPRSVISSIPKAIPNRMFNEDSNDQFILPNNTNTRNTIYYTPSSSFNTPNTIEPSPKRLNSHNDNDRYENTDSDDYNINDNDYGLKLFWTSAKTGDGVDQVFEYIAKYLVHKKGTEKSLNLGRQNKFSQMEFDNSDNCDQVEVHKLFIRGRDSDTSSIQIMNRHNASKRSGCC